jgi:hypothetical protein
VLSLLILPPLQSVTSIFLARIFTFAKFQRHFLQPLLSPNRVHNTNIEDTMTQLQRLETTTLSKAETAARSAAEPADEPASPTLIAMLVDHTKNVLQLTENAMRTLRTHVALTKAHIAHLSSQTQVLKIGHKLRAMNWELVSAEKDCQKGERARIQMTRFMEAVEKDALRWTQAEAESLWKVMERYGFAGQ